MIETRVNASIKKAFFRFMFEALIHRTDRENYIRKALRALEMMTMAGTPPLREIVSLINNHIHGFKHQNIELFLVAFLATSSIIIDGIAPYRWMNPNAPANWLADVAKWRADLGVSYEHLSYEMGFWNVEGSVAYAVIAGTLTVTIRGQNIIRTGTLAYTFSKHSEEWKIEAQAWGRTS